MLCDLHIKDFAIIDSLQLSFQQGLNMLSGETGAGKSIIVGALNLLLGGRASVDLIRTAKDEAVVEAVFDLAACKEAQEYLRSWDIAAADEQVIIRRIITKSGKNKIIIGDRLATMQMLSQLGGCLIDISGQFSQQLLLQAENHLDILDRYGGLMPLRDTYQSHYAAFNNASGELTKLIEHDRNKERRRELLSFQHDEIEKAQLCPGEEENLLKERKILANAEKLHEKTYGVYTSMYEADDSLLGALKKAAIVLDEAAAIDPELSGYKEEMQSAVIRLDDLVLSLRAYAEKIPTDNHRLEYVENRLSEMQRLKKKYGKSLEELVAFKQEIQDELKNLEGASKRIEELQKELAAEAKNLWQLAEELSEKRDKAAKRLKKSIEDELATIGMKKTAFVTRFQHAARPTADDNGLGELHARGMDNGEFYIAPNVGEEPRPLSRIASGGELSRIVLAIKKILARNYRVATLLFDEVDAGIGGAIAEAVGEKLQEIAKTHQVLCITHLPQIACFGNAHFSVRKNVQAGRTVTSVNLLDSKERIEEITRMLGGKQVTEKTRAHAVEMLQSAGSRK